MKPAVYNVTTVTVLTRRDGHDLPYVFRATGRELLDPGFLRVYELEGEAAAAETASEADGDSADNAQLPPLAKGDDLRLHRLIPAQHFTSPPPYFTDAALIQELERLGIGRPSTFANIVDTLYERGYVAKFERALRSSELGRAVCDFLVRHFPSVFAVDFTARMEDQLDDIANGEAQWTAVMAQMWGPLSALVAQAQAAVAGQPKIKVAGIEAGPGKGWKGRGRKGGGQKSAGRKSGGRKGGSAGKGAGSAATPTGQACPQCGQPLVQRTSKFGPFIGCSGYPKCRYIAKPDKGAPAAEPAD